MASQLPPPAQSILEYLRSLPQRISSNIAAAAYLTVADQFRPSPGDDYISLVETYLYPDREFDRQRVVVLLAGAIDHHLSIVKGFSSEEYLTLARKMPTELFQMGALTGDDDQAAFEEAKQAWWELRETILSPLAIIAYFR